jgi:PKD repeat protein
VSVNGAGSSDSDGTVSSYAWDFGDGATGTGATTSHPYATAGTYQVKLTVTDDDGGTGTVSHSVTVTAAPASSPFVVDDFERSVASGLGSADTGGAWTTSNSTGFSVAGGAGIFTLTSPGMTRSAYLGSTLRTSSDIQLTYSSDKAATGSGTYLKVSGRRISSTLDYRAEVMTSSSGKVVLSLSALQGSSTSVPMGGSVTLPGTLTAGEQVRVRVQSYPSATGTTTVRAKAWWGGSTEPASWQASATNSYAALQDPGAVGLTTYISSSATNVPVKLSFSSLTAQPVTP